MSKIVNQPDEIVDGQTIRRAFSGNVIKSIDKEKRQIEFIISTASVDRYGDVVEVNGWDLKNYKANPVVLFGHMSSIPPIGKAIKTWKDGDALRSIAEFIPQDISAFAHSIFRMYEEGFLRAVSVGFKPLKYDPILDEEGHPTYGYRFLKQELLEFSAVPIPANPDALVNARQKGIDTGPFKAWAEEMLDRWNETEAPLQSLYGVDRKSMETIRRRAAGAGANYRVPTEVQDELMKRNLEAIRAAKAKKLAEETNTVMVTVKGVEYELPQLEKAAEGKVTVEMDEINGEKTLHILEAGDECAFTIELLDTVEDKFITVEERSGDDEAKNGLVVTMKGDNLEVEYNMVGVSDDGNLVGVKMSETVMTKDTDDEAVAEEAEAEADSADETAEDAVADEVVEDAGDAAEAETVADAAAVEAEAADEAADEKVDMDFPTHLHYMETVLNDFEEALEGVDIDGQSRRDYRRLNFLAGYMRELADRMDGGKTENKTATLPVTKKVEEEEELTPDEATRYIKSVTESLQPLLIDMITQKIGIMRGRLD